MTNKISYLDDGEICFLTKDNAEFYNSKGTKINKKILTLSEDTENYEKGDLIRVLDENKKIKSI